MFTNFLGHIYVLLSASLCLSALYKQDVLLVILWIEFS